ncbi:hypothetical protein [Kitasatospora sp. NPDC056731]|uniref:hypothetical protein n=1 Tax=Kitasatospora sp. NPDC056731 TaxID=3155422 RepID=UPI00342C9239
MTATPPPSLRERIAQAVPYCRDGCDFCEPTDVAAVVLAIVQPELDRRDAEIERLRVELATARNATLAEGAELILRRAEEQYQRSYSDNKIFEFNGGKRAADLLLAARDTTS